MQNSRVWCLNAENEWTLGVVESTNKEESIISTTDVKVLKAINKWIPHSSYSWKDMA